MSRQVQGIQQHAKGEMGRSLPVSRYRDIEELAALVRETFNANPVLRARWLSHFPKWPDYTRLVNDALSLDETIRIAEKALPVLRRVREAKAARKAVQP